MYSKGRRAWATLLWELGHDDAFVQAAAATAHMLAEGRSPPHQDL